MATGRELKDKFWSELSDSPFVMLGLSGVDESHTQPMTAQFDDDIPNRLYFYSNRQNRLIKALSSTHNGIIAFSSKGHSLFASVHGQLSLDNDRAIIERFWSPVVSAWYEQGKDDPDLALLRFDCGRAEIWQSTTSNFLHYMAAGLFGDGADEASKDDVKEVYF